MNTSSGFFCVGIIATGERVLTCNAFGYTMLIEVCEPYLGVTRLVLKEKVSAGTYKVSRVAAATGDFISSGLIVD